MKAKSSKKNSNRNRVNFQNPKTKMIVAHMMLGENRITKQEIMQIGNKDIFYQLLHSNYIVEKEKGQYVGTQKLHDYAKRTESKSFSSSSSFEHSQALRTSLSLLPKEVLLNGHYRSSTDIERTFKRAEKSQEYRERLGILRNQLDAALVKSENSLNAKVSNSNSEEEILRAKLQYQGQMADIESQKQWLSEQTYLVPDYEVSLTPTELEQYISNLTDYRNALDESSKAYYIYSESIEKLKQIPTDQAEITLSIEIITSAYGNREISLHKNFEVLSQTNQIFLM